MVSAFLDELQGIDKGGAATAKQPDTSYDANAVAADEPEIELDIIDAGYLMYLKGPFKSAGTVTADEDEIERICEAKQPP